MVQTPIKSTALTQALVDGLSQIPSSWALTPVRENKRPYRENWQTEKPLSRKEIASEIRSGKAKGYGLRTGVISGGIVAVDADGHAAHDKILELSGGEALPDTIAFTSDKPGRCQYLFYIPQDYWEVISTKKIAVAWDENKKPIEFLEFRWDGCQSVVPPSVHPETGRYRWRRSAQEVSIAPAPMWVIEQMLDDPQASKPSVSHPEQINLPVDDVVPLTACLTKRSREMIESRCTTADKGRNDSGVELARDLIGTANYLDKLGQRYDGNPEFIFFDWCRDVGLDRDKPKGQPQSIWKSANKGNAQPGSGENGVEACIRGWYWREHIKPSGRGYTSNRRSFGSGSGGNGGDGGQLATLSLRDRVLEILNRNQDRSHRDEAFINLALITATSVREIKELAASIESEVDLEESRADRKAEVEKLLKIGEYRLDLQDYLDPSVASPLERVAGWMGTTSAAMLTTLYPVVGSLLPVGTRLELIKATDFYALPVIYAGLVCESGGGKSPAQKTIINPLFALQDEAEFEYKQRLLNYQAALAEWKKIKDNEEPAPELPTPHEYYTTDATSEAIALIQSQQPNHGFLGWFDELPALFKSQGQYKNGRGADGEKILSGRDGTGFKVNRASGKRLVVSQSAYSITGSLQPLILRQMMGDFTDANGQWARFLWTVMQVQPAPYPDNAIPFDVSGLLKGIYRRISKLVPQTYKLSPKAQKLYRNWYNELDQFKMSESRQGLRAVYSKMKGDTGVLALLLHCFNGCVNEGSIPDWEISEQTMTAAIKLAKYHIGQVKLIHSEGDVANGELAAIHAKIIQLSERKGWLKAADVRDIDRQIKKQFSADAIRRHFRELKASGFGQTRGEGTKLMWTIHQDNDTPPRDKLRTNSGQTQDSLEIAGSVTNTDVQSFIENSLRKTQGNSGQTQDSLETPGSVTNTGVQQPLNKTQDTQDSFAVVQKTLVVPPVENETKDVVPNFDVLSCPELVGESCDSVTVGISAQDKTQDTCPETVLSCPELCPDVPIQTNQTESDEAASFARIEFLISVLPAIAENWLLEDLDQLRVEVSGTELNAAAKRLSSELHARIKQMVLATPGAQIKYGENTGRIAAKSQDGKFFIKWDVHCERLAHRRGDKLPGALRIREFQVVSGQ